MKTHTHVAENVIFKNGVHIMPQRTEPFFGKDRKELFEWCKNLWQKQYTILYLAHD